MFAFTSFASSQSSILDLQSVAFASSPHNPHDFLSTKILTILLSSQLSLRNMLGPAADGAPSAFVRALALLLLLFLHFLFSFAVHDACAIDLDAAVLPATTETGARLRRQHSRVNGTELQTLATDPNADANNLGGSDKSR